jgi:hypothetical protein
VFLPLFALRALIDRDRRRIEQIAALGWVTPFYRRRKALADPKIDEWR